MSQSSLLYKSPEELLDQSVRDSPFFRETIATFETDMEEVLKWLDGLNKTLRLYTDDLTKSNEVTTALVGKLGVQNLSSSSLALDGSVVRVFADALQTVYSLKAKLVDDLLENLINPIQQFIREDIREMKDYRRNFDKVSEKYDWAIQKYFSLSKNKEQSALKEDAYVLYETRKAHVKLSLDYTSKIIFFKQNLQHVITDQLLSALFAHTDYYDTSFDVFKGLKPHIENLKNKLEEDRAVQIANRPKIISMKKTLEEETILKTKPGSNNNESHSSMNRNNTIKEGNLYKRTKTNGMIVPTWSRKYFYIKNQGFTYVVDQKKNGKHILSEAIPINVLLLNFRISNKEDRRFTFEIYSSTKSFVLQAETEEEMNSWIRALQTAKNASAKGERSSSTTNMLADDAESLNTDSLVFDSDEEEEASELLSSRRASITENSISVDEGESLKYNDISLERKNNELHNLLKSVPKTDYVFDVFSCAYQKDIGIQGKIYVTQKRICFYSNILTFVTILVIDYQNIINLNRKTTPFFTSIQIETAETSHLFKIFLKDDLKPFNLMRMLWNNANSNQPSSVQELYNTSIGTQEKPPLTTSASVIVGGGSNPKIAEDWEIPSFAKSKSVLPGDSEMFTSPEDSTPKGSYELPENITTPVGETPCNCDDHLDKKEHDIVLPIAAKQLYDQLFSENCTIMDKYHKISKNKDVNYGQWNGDDDLKTREVKFIVPVSNPMVRVTETECIENQTILKRNEHL